MGQLARKLGLTDDRADVRIQALQSTIDRVGGIEFKVVHQESGEWVAESKNVDGIITGGNSYPNDVSETIKDAIFTYFEIPAHLCNDTILRQRGDVAQVEERVYA